MAEDAQFLKLATIEQEPAANSEFDRERGNLKESHLVIQIKNRENLKRALLCDSELVSTAQKKAFVSHA